MKATVLLAGLAVTLASCASSRPGTISSSELTWIVNLPKVAPPETLGAGFGTQRTDDAVLAAGDRVLFEVIFERDAERTLKYLAFEVLGRFVRDGQRMFMNMTLTSTQEVEGGDPVTLITEESSPGFRVRIDQYDDKAALAGNSEVMLAEFVGLGQVDACESFVGLEETTLEGNSAAVQEFMTSFQSLISLVSLAQGDELLSDLMWDVIDKPSIFSVITSLGVNVVSSPRYDLARELPGGIEGLNVPGPLWAFPITFTINDELALTLDVIVADASPPWSITSGIVAFQGQHPTKDVRVLARLVGARSGD